MPNGITLCTLHFNEEPANHSPENSSFTKDEELLFILKAETHEDQIIPNHCAIIHIQWFPQG